MRGRLSWTCRPQARRLRVVQALEETLYRSGNDRSADMHVVFFSGMSALSAVYGVHMVWCVCTFVIAPLGLRIQGIASSFDGCHRSRYSTGPTSVAADHAPCVSLEYVLNFRRQARHLSSCLEAAHTALTCSLDATVVCAALHFLQVLAVVCWPCVVERVRSALSIVLLLAATPAMPFPCTFHAGAGVLKAAGVVCTFCTPVSVGRA